MGHSVLPVSCLSAKGLSTRSRSTWRNRAASFFAVALVAALASCAARREPTLRVGGSGDYAPFHSDSDGILRGLDVEIARRFAKDEGLQLVPVIFAWPELNGLIERGELDVAMSGVTMRPERALAGRYTRPYATSGAVALIRAVDAPRFPDRAALERSGVRLAVNAGGHLERVARTLFPNAAIEPVADNRSLPSRLTEGTADAVLTDSAEALAWWRTDFRVLGPFTSDHKAFLLPAGRDDLAAHLDAWLVAREADGWLAALRARWLGGGQPADPSAATREAVVALIELRTGLMPLVAAAKRQARLPIEDRAQEARVIDRIRSETEPLADRAADVYRVLIEIAKAVQRRAGDGNAAAPLAALRDALARIDAQLVRELLRLPETDAAAWDALLVRGLDVDPEIRRRLAAALAGASLRSR